ncbi:diguanylate cyclase domain-containing protein [Fusibacter tunisiensis]|uniref:Diguanylate cyclase (GGDEF)-like protein n=1 Tax=Fusibacter tunisiensis TaxID=1008308 RepID=A0ABS2MNG7_9FIRM|nr:diguanylate cyclase [Fusibacter tunisiensis]MBM7560953.1 diguanylate cyclase (GGDEF)-like protein [Fusibacter tunisiensis]
MKQKKGILIKLILAAIFTSLLPTYLYHLIQRENLYTLYIIISLYTFFIIATCYQLMTHEHDKREKELKALVHKEDLINNELILINTEEKLKSVLSLEIERILHSGGKAALLCFDINDLGRYNKNYGFDVGDQIIIELILCTKSMLDDQFKLARIKGDTFAVVFPDYDGNQTFEFAKKLRDKIDAIQFDVKEGISCRFAVIEIDRWMTEDKLLKLAYEKLTLAKDYGKWAIL